MFFELVGVVMAGLAAALFVYAIRRWAPERIPAWLLPAAAGGAMIAAGVSSEYGWYDRMSSQLPEGFVVAQTVQEQSALRPWSYVVPYTGRFIAIDLGTMKTHPDLPDQRITELWFFGRWAPLHRVPVLWDCADARRARLGEGVDFAADGTVKNATWEPVAPDDPVLRAACAGA